ncbi:LysR substrate-binding domain-containing protein [Marinobacterium mangrovicola]|uniref:LysR family transcriptional regulator n=1 Tax=Marinobacterium mangrovicola TaxID=1476959 RepID=A0A4R1H7I1_9GAMM|nr:LysR substrate-binding domain-containing protein [Marinobacterium mangrovicola]TCK16411.1 LysR family transcriptional regulator [Marinobacterium mangrovicola]
MRVEIRQLKAFLAVAERLHFGQAAAALHLTQPALSRTIQQLEEAIGEDLLIRSNRSVSLTEVGKVFMEKAQRIVDDLDEAIEIARQAGRGEHGILRIGYTDIAILGVLPRIVRNFRDIYPNVDIQLIHLPNVPQIQMLGEDKLDIAFVSGMMPVDGFESREVKSDRFVALLPSDHPLTERSSLSLDDLKDEPFVIGEMRTWRDFRRNLDALFLEHGFEPHVIQEASNSQAVFAFVGAGMGVSIHIETAGYRAGDNLAVRPLHDVNTTFQTSAVWLGSADFALKRRFLEHLEKELVN